MERAVTEYFGRGTKAHRVAEMAGRRREREEVQAERVQFAELDIRLAKLASDIQVVAKAALVAAGCYSHKGMWRRLGMESSAEDGHELVERLRELAKKANSGDQQALFGLRTMLAEDRQLVEHLGNLARHLEATLLEQLAGHDALTREAVREYLNSYGSNLAGPQPTEIERLLVDQIAVCYLADRQAVHMDAADSSNPQLATLRAKRAESTQKRLLASLKMLTTLRAFAPAGLVPAQLQCSATKHRLLA